MTIQQSRQSIKQKFNEHADQYDSQRKKLIPCFDDFYSIPVSIIDIPTSSPAVLDIGAGTGLFASLVLKKYPEANMTLIDLSEKMMDIAKKRLASFASVNYIIDDYTTHEYEHTFDIIVSSLSIHHLTDAEKQKLYKRVYSLLNTDGIFINADQVLGHTPYVDELYKQDWKNKIEHSGLTQEELMAAYERTKLDKMSPLADQLKWLTDSGFDDVDCIYKYFNFVVLFGRKI